MKTKGWFGSRQVAQQVALSAVMAALVAVATFIVQIPNPATGGYINFGDIMIFVSAFVFGPFVGGFAGAVGSAMSDLASPYAYYAPYTFVIKGVEGMIAGLVSNQKSYKRDILATIVGGLEMIIGYFLAQTFPLQFGFLAALTELPGNISQAVIGAVVGIPVALALRKRLPESWTKTKPRNELPTA